jgi:hypothetical protein
MTSESPSVIKGVTPSVLAVPATTAPRFIPGLASSMVTPAAKKRARKTIKAKTAVVVPSEAPDSPVDIKEVESKIEASESPVVVAEEAKVELGDDVIGDEPLKITNAVEAVQKRVRAANKKIVSNLSCINASLSIACRHQFVLFHFCGEKRLTSFNSRNVSNESLLTKLNLKP